MCRIGIYQVCRGFGWQLGMSKWKSFFDKNGMNWDILLSQMLAAVKHIAAEIIVFLGKQHNIELCMPHRHSPTAATKILSISLFPSYGPQQSIAEPH